MIRLSKRTQIILYAVLAAIGLIAAGFLFSQKEASNNSAEYRYEGNTNRNIFGSNPSYSKVYFVSANGNDNNDGTTLKTPFKTIDKAISFAAAGDMVELADGEYRQTVSSVKNGQKGSPITIRGSKNAVIRGAENEGRVIEIKHNFIVLSGFTIDGQSGNGNGKNDYRDKLIYAIGTGHKKGVEGLVVKDMLIQNAGGECVRLRYFAANNEVSNSTIKNCGIHDFRFKGGGKNGEGIYIGTAPEQRKDGKNPTADPDESNSNLVRDNIIETHGNECVDIKESSSKNVVERNTCQFQLDDNSGGFDARGSYNVFRNNISKNNLGAGIRLGGDTEKDGLYNDAYGNTISNNKAGAFKLQRMPQGKICENTTFDDEDEEESTSGIQPDASCR